jgi:fucose 4-O-acetylase-like acetyltransferase
MIKRLDYIDIAKGIGILTVIFSHSGGEKGMMAYIGGFFIPLFFILSGMTYSNHGERLAVFVSRKFRRLLFPYFFFSIVLLIVYRHFSVTDVLGVFYSRYCLYPFHVSPNISFMESGNAPLWFLTAMFSSLVLFRIFPDNKKAQYWLIGAYVALICFSVYLPILLPWSIDTAFLFSLFIYIGTKLKSVDWDRLDFLKFFLLVAIYFALCYINGKPNLSVREYGLSFVLILFTGTLGTMIIIKVSQWLEKSILRTALVAFGQHSLTIFCIQMLLLRIQNHLIFDLMGLPLNTCTLYISSITKTIVTACVGVYLSKLLKRYLPLIFK